MFSPILELNLRRYFVSDNIHVGSEQTQQGYTAHTDITEVVPEQQHGLTAHTEISEVVPEH